MGEKSGKKQLGPIGDVELAEITKSALPTHMDDKDRLEAMLAAEQVRAAQARLQLAQEQLQARVDHESRILFAVRAKYTMKDGDTYDMATGAITRQTVNK